MATIRIVYGEIEVYLDLDDDNLCTADVIDVLPRIGNEMLRLNTALTYQAEAEAGKEQQ